MEMLFSMIVQVVITFLVVKLYVDLSVKKTGDGKPKKIDWKDAAPVIEKLETRISQLQERDQSHQERVWNLEDQIRLLKLHLAEYKRQAGSNQQPFTTEPD
jgi:Co/Zn/Cd efflux system component